MIEWILFDLDGTLLPMDQEAFVKDYFGRLALKLEPYGYNPEELPLNLWKGVKAMVANDGEWTNESVFWSTFEDIYGEEVYDDIEIFDEFYRKEFLKCARTTKYNPKAKECVEKLKKDGYKLVLATNPIFPKTATENRMHWAGFESEDFRWVTTYETSGFCKPNIKYYEEILDILTDLTGLDIKPEECLMVGNDVDEDMVAAKLGMKVFLLDDCLINKHNKDIENYPHGSFEQLIEYIEKIKFE